MTLDTAPPWMCGRSFVAFAWCTLIRIVNLRTSLTFAARALLALTTSTACKSEPPPSPAPSAQLPEPDDTGVLVQIEATTADNGADGTAVSCSRTVLCAGLQLAPHRPTTKFTITGPSGAVVEINGASVTLSRPQPSAAARAQLDVALEYGDLSLEKLFAPMAELPKLDLRVKIKRRNGAEENETVSVDIGAASLLQILRGSGLRATTFRGDSAEPHKPPIIYSERGMKQFYGEPKLVRDVDVIALWEPRDRREGKSCGFYQSRPMGPSSIVDHYLQDYQLRVVDRRSGKLLAERALIAKEARCPESFLSRPGEAWTTDPDYGEADKILSALRP